VYDLRRPLSHKIEDYAEQGFGEMREAEQDKRDDRKANAEAQAARRDFQATMALTAPAAKRMTSKARVIISDEANDSPTPSNPKDGTGRGSVTRC
jgi:hypothetical protein